jgi:hypothetical protein
MKDGLVIEVALATAYVKNEHNGITYIIFKYYEEASYWMYRIPLYRPVPSFDIDLTDLSPQLKDELGELKKFDPSRSFIKGTIIFNIHKQSLSAPANVNG